MPALGTQSPLLHQMLSEQTGDAAENKTERVPALMAFKGVQIAEKQLNKPMQTALGSKRYEEN